MATMTSSIAPARNHGARPARLRWLSTALATRRQRATLAGLDDARLDDIGLSRDAALAEARRPFWDISGPTSR